MIKRELTANIYRPGQEASPNQNESYSDRKEITFWEWLQGDYENVEVVAVVYVI